MPVILQKWILREDLRHNPNVLYLFGDNEQRVGLGGQAKEMRGEPNAVGVRTKVAPSMEESAFWSDERYEECCKMVDEDLHRPIDSVIRGGVVVIPADGLGTGFSQLPDRAPRVLAYLEASLKSMGEWTHYS